MGTLPWKNHSHFSGGRWRSTWEEKLLSDRNNNITLGGWPKTTQTSDGWLFTQKSRAQLLLTAYVRSIFLSYIRIESTIGLRCRQRNPTARVNRNFWHHPLTRGLGFSVCIGDRCLIFFLPLTFKCFVIIRHFFYF